MIKKRLNVYHRQTEPLKAHYVDKNLYLPIEGTGVVDEIFNKITDSLEAKTGAVSTKRM